MKKILVSLVLMGALSGCSDAARKQITTYGSSAEVVCYSGGKEVGRWKSTGKVATEEHSDGWFFEDSDTGKLIRTNADCVVIN